MERFEYYPSGKELLTQTDIAKKQYPKFNDTEEAINKES